MPHDEQKTFPEDYRGGHRLHEHSYPIWLRDIAVSRARQLQVPEKPNFVVIFIDDMGYGDIEPFGSTTNKTPEPGFPIWVFSLGPGIALKCLWSMAEVHFQLSKLGESNG